MSPCGGGSCCCGCYGFLGWAVRGGGGGGLDDPALPEPEPELDGDWLFERGVAVPSDPLLPCV